MAHPFTGPEALTCHAVVRRQRQRSRVALRYRHKRVAVPSRARRHLLGALAALLMALNFLGDGLRDVFDPKAANER